MILDKFLKTKLEKKGREQRFTSSIHNCCVVFGAAAQAGGGVEWEGGGDGGFQQHVHYQ